MVENKTFNSGRLEYRSYRYPKVSCLREDQGSLPAVNENFGIFVVGLDYGRETM